ncbi:MAG: glycoside hydrolase family 3 C-terminal domain-containing protein [Prolixibacteraceae bacterium]|nr:glycoside hydrolase family 3 C-terminal domain-containing protein [Prolixibacteraceae bacterium]
MFASWANTILLFAGGDEFTAKEAYFNNAIGDRDCIDPVGLQDELIIELKKTGKPVIVILNHRRTLSINAFAKHADAILDCWELSEFGDNAIAKTVFGLNVPSGKLSVTVPRTIGQLPFHYSQKDINYKKGYLFNESTPLFTFGHGLSYSTFKYTKPIISDPVLTNENKKITLQVEVENTGDYKAKEVVQLYIKDIIGTVVRPMKELKGFKKIELQSGEKTIVQFDITTEMLEFTTLNMKQEAENGGFVAMIGGSSDSLQTVEFKLEK